MFFIYELYVWEFSLVEDDSHDSLSVSHRTVDFSVNLIDADWVSFTNEGIKDIFAEFLAFNDDLLALGMQVSIENCKSVDSVCLFGDSWSDWSWIKTIEASSSNNWDLGPPGD